VALCLGGFLVLATWLAVLGVSALVLFNVYWAAALGWALWAQADTRAHDLQRYERVFPLEPVALFFTMLFAWPVALPCYFHIKDQVLEGRRSLSTGRSRAKYAFLTLVVLAGAAGIGVTAWARYSPTMRGLMRVSDRMRVVTHDQLRVELTSDHRALITVVNSQLPANDAAARAGQARQLAVVFAASADSTWSVDEVAVAFATDSDTVGFANEQKDQSYAWPLAELRKAKR
jgi:hypothetical protein